MAEYEARVSEAPICDFCSDVEPRYLEDCETFEATMLDGRTIGRSVGEWAACQTCHDLIQARKWHVLERRATEAMLRKYPSMPKSRVQHGVQVIHGQFRRHKPVEELNP